MSTPLASPAAYFDVTFNADAGKPYHVWLRGVAQKNDYNNDSVFLQFDHSVDASGTPFGASTPRRRPRSSSRTAVNAV
jgi:hypothetical protein